MVVDGSPTKENRISEYDNLDMAENHAHQYSKLEKKASRHGVESPSKKMDALKKENFFSRFHINLKKKRKSLYKANSEPFLNSQFFDPTLCQEEKDSIESLDCEVEWEKASKEK